MGFTFFPSASTEGRGRTGGTAKVGRFRLFLLVFLAALGPLAFGCAVFSDRADRVREMEKEELKGRLGNPDLLVLDVRKGPDWEGSARKIPGAVHENYERVGEWARKYPRQRTLVLYCA